MRGSGASWLALALVLLGGCASAIQQVGLKLYYRHAPLPDEQVHPDLAYRESATGEAHDKHKLDLYRPSADGWQAMLFVHGGGFDKGDRALTAAGQDVYGNIGRYFAGRGIGVAVISYRLQPEVGWREQVDDVAAALAWVRRRAASHGGVDGPVVLAGHSAGAWLASRVALDEEVLAAHGLTRGDIAGVVAVSGAGYDLTDERTWELGADPRWWSSRFQAEPEEAWWRQEGSIVPRLGESPPPFLIAFTSHEWPALGYQNRLLHHAVRRAGGASRLLMVPAESHSRMALAMSFPEHSLPVAITDFVGSVADHD